MDNSHDNQNANQDGNQAFLQVVHNDQMVHNEAFLQV